MAELRTEFSKGGLEASLLAAQLLEIVEKLDTQLRAAEALAANARRDVAAREADQLERQLLDGSHDECPACHDRRARLELERLRAIAAGEGEADPRRRVR